MTLTSTKFGKFSSIAKLKTCGALALSHPLNVQWGWWGFGGGRGDAS